MRSLSATFESDSTFEYAYSGTYLDAHNMYEYSGSGTIPLNSSSGKMFSGAAYLFPDGNTGQEEGYYQLNITASATCHVKETDLSDGSVTEYDVPEFFAITINDSIGYYGTIPAGSTTYGEYNVRWQETVPDCPPDKYTPG